jgi:hypothetical protein
MRLSKCALLAIIVSAASVSETASQPLTAADQLKLVSEYAHALCETVKEPRGGKTASQLQADVQAKVPGLWKHFDIGGGVKGSIDRETIEGLTQEATAAALAADRDCRKEMVLKLWEKLGTPQATPQSAPQSVPAVLTPKAAACAINLIIYKAIHVAGVAVGPPGPWENAIDYVIEKYPTLPDRASIANSCSEVANLPRWPPATSEEREHWLKVWSASLPHDLELIEPISPLAAKLHDALRFQPWTVQAPPY